jgi:hypothetical protein
MPRCMKSSLPSAVNSSSISSAGRRSGPSPRPVRDHREMEAVDPQLREAVVGGREDRHQPAADRRRRDRTEVAAVVRARVVRREQPQLARGDAPGAVRVMRQRPPARIARQRPRRRHRAAVHRQAGGAEAHLVAGHRQDHLAESRRAAGRAGAAGSVAQVPAAPRQLRACRRRTDQHQVAPRRRPSQPAARDLEVEPARQAGAGVDPGQAQQQRSDRRHPRAHAGSRPHAGPLAPACAHERRT